LPLDPREVRSAALELMGNSRETDETIRVAAAPEVSVQVLVDVLVALSNTKATLSIERSVSGDTQRGLAQ
jgi:hypothetical protein